MPGAIDYWVSFHDPAGVYAGTYYDVEPDGWPNDIPLVEGENGSVSQALQLVDIIAPTTTITSAPLAPDGDHDWYVTEPAITLTASEPGATIWYEWNSEGVGEYSTPIHAYEGTNLLAYWSQDGAGNTEAPANTRTFKLDTVDPTVPTGVSAVATSDTSARLSWLPATDATSGIWHYLVYDAAADALVATVTGTSADVTGLSPGTAYSFYVVAQDNAGRVSVHSATDNVTTTGTDATPPVTQIYVFPAAADGLDGWYLSAPSVLFGTGEVGTTTYYYWDSATEAEYTVPLSAPEGQHIIHYHSRDAASNAETEQSLGLKVDTVDPSTPTGVSAVALGTTSIGVSWTAATDATSGIWHYLVYDAATDALVATVTDTSADVTGLLPGTAYSFYVVAEDNAGRTGAESAEAGATTTGAPTTLMPIYRFYRQSTGTHFYTADSAEMQRVRDTMGATYAFEGVCYSVNTANPANTVPLYRLYNRKTGTHLYTADEGEKNAILASLPDTYSLDGVAYYVSMTSGLQVHRFYSPSKGVHFYSADPAEIAHVRATLSAVWQYEGLAY